MNIYFHEDPFSINYTDNEDFNTKSSITYDDIDIINKDEKIYQIYKTNKKKKQEILKQKVGKAYKAYLAYVKISIIDYDNDTFNDIQNLKKQIK